MYELVFFIWNLSFFEGREGRKPSVQGKADHQSYWKKYPMKMGEQ